MGYSESGGSGGGGGSSDWVGLTDTPGAITALQIVRGNAAGTDLEFVAGAPPALHAADHEDGGGDEIDVTGLSGELADDQPPKAHAVEHAPGGGDAMAVDAAAGVGSLRTLGTGAQQAASGTDGRLSDARTPLAHKASHQHGGADEVGSATAAANVIPKANGSGELANGFISAAGVTQHVGAIDHNSLLNYIVTQHRVINDSGTSTTELWSASKISAQISAALYNFDNKDNVVTVADSNITLSGEQTINGVLTSGSRVGVVGQTAAQDNGIYVSAAGAWSRSTDADQDSEVTNGMSFYVSQGTKSGFQYLLITADPITVGTTSLVFSEIPRIVLGTSAGTACEGNDSRIPTQDENDALVGTSGSPSTSNKYVTNADSRNSDARTPTSHASSHDAGGGDAMAIDAAAGTGSLRTLGTGATAACAGNDARLSDARTPTSHAASHLPAGGDPITTATPSTIGTSNAAGSAESLVRSDHIHSHGNQTSGTLHAAAISGSTNGFLTGADKAYIEALKTSYGNASLVSKSGNDGTAVLHNIGRPYLTIQAAINASASGDVVIVLPGAYSGPIVCKDGVSVIGADARNCVITRALTADGTVLTMAENMRLENFLFYATVTATFTATVVDWGTGTAHMTSVMKNCIGGVSGAGDGVVLDFSGVAGLALQASVCVQDCILSELSTGGGIGYLGGGTAATVHVRMARTRLIVAGTASIGASVVGELSADNCYFEGVGSGVSCLTPSANNVFNYNQGTGWNSITGGGTLARLWTSFDHSLQSGSVYVDAIFGNDATAVISDRSRPYLTIQSAIDNASAGMIVEVGPGSYSETVTCKDEVSVRGADRASCIITGTGVSATLVTMAADMVFERFTVNVLNASGTSVGVAFTGTDNETSVLRDCNINGGGAGTADGVDLSACTNSTAYPHACMDGVLIDVDGEDIDPTAAKTQGIKGEILSYIDEGGVIRHNSRRTSTLTRRVGMQKGSSASMFWQTVPSQATATEVTRGALVGWSYANAATEATNWFTQIDERHVSDGGVTIKILWYNDTVQTGSKVCRFQLNIQSLVEGEVVPATAELIAQQNHALGADEAANTWQETYYIMAASHANNFQYLSMKLERLGSDAADTMTGEAVVCNVRLACAT